MVPDSNKYDQPEKDKKEKVFISPVVHGSTTSIPLRPSKKKIVLYEPCVVPMELFNMLKDSENLIVLNKSTEIDDEFLKGKMELIFTKDPINKTIDSRQNVKEINLSNKKTTIHSYISDVMSRLETSLRDIGTDDAEDYRNEEDETSQEN